MTRDFLADDRAIEGLPIRLVIALVVGVASLGVMMNMLSGVQGLTVEELDVRPEPEVIGDEKRQVDLTVVDTSGQSISDATVVITGGTATIDGVTTGTTGPNGTATLSIAPSLGSNQRTGTLEVHIKPPAGSQYADERANTEILVVKE